MRAINWFLELFPTPRRTRERTERLQAARDTAALAWATRYFEPRMAEAARSVALVLCEVEGIPVLKHDPSARLIEDLNLSDLEPAQLAMRLEKMLKIKIPDEHAESLLTMSDWVTYVYAKLLEHSA
jgi:acyl carrier protein